MKKYTILTDSCSNMVKADRDKYDIKMVFNPFYIEGEEKSHPASPDFDLISGKEYYDIMRSGKRITTTMVNASEFEKAFEEEINKGNDVLYLGCALKLSASYNQALEAKKTVLAKYPDAKIECVNTKNACYALGMLIIDAAKRRDNGMSLEDNLKEVLKTIDNYNEIGTVDKLVYLKRAGRVSAPSAFFGGLLGIKPIIVSDKEGGNAAVEKVKGRQKSFDRMIEIIKKYIDSKEHKIIYMNHADCLEEAKDFAKSIALALDDKDITFQYNFIEPAVGASVGPGTIILNFYADPKMRDDFSE